jgi:hypothetical protein
MTINEVGGNEEDKEDGPADGSQNNEETKRSIRIVRLRLEHQWMAAKLTSPATFLPYSEAAKWVQKHG